MCDSGATGEARMVVDVVSKMSSSKMLSGVEKDSILKKALGGVFNEGKIDFEAFLRVPKIPFIYFC